MGLTQWFENRSEGIEHGFTLDTPPHGQGEIEIILEVKGTASPEWFSRRDSDTEGVRFVESDGTAVAEYIGLKAWDSSGRTLNAEMMVRGQDIVLRLDDQGARYPITIDPLFVSPQARLTGNSAFIDAYFGDSVSISGDLAIVGSYQEDLPSGANAGAAYLFARDGATWKFQVKISAADGGTGDEFGRSTAIDGTTAIVGAPRAASSGESNVGSAYVFTQNGAAWEEQASLTFASGQPGDQFGRSVSISGDTVMIGARGRDTAAGTDAGSVSFYLRTETAWGLQQTIDSTVSGEEFGHAVAIDRDIAIAGAHLSNAGAANQSGRAYVLTRTGSAWTLGPTLQAPSPSASDEFGYSVAISDNTALIGTLQANSAYAFIQNSGAWDLERIFSESVGLFGVSVAIDGDTAVVGAEYDSTTGGINAGGAFVYTRNTGLWTDQAKLEASDSSAFDLFGRSVSVSGNTILVGAPYDDTSTAINAGSAYFFERSAGIWSEQTRVTNGESGATGLFGFSTDLSGDTAIIGATLEDTEAGIDAGVAYVFLRQAGGIWSQQARLTADDGSDEDHFGNSVAIDGALAAVGAVDDDTLAGVDAGSTYFFTRSNSSWTLRDKVSGTDSSDQFGESVALDTDTVIVGSPLNYTFIPPRFDLVIGSASVYRWDGSSLVFEEKLLPSMETGFLRFGESVAISGETALVGAPFGNTPSATQAGAAYVFTRAGESWSQQTRLFASDGQQVDQFGDAVGIDGDIAIIGALTGDTAGNSDSGSAYVFECNENSWLQTARLTPTTIAADDFFGYSVAVSGNTVVVGAPSTNGSVGQDVGSAYIFQKNGQLWNQQATLSAGLTAASTGFFGAAMAADGDTVLIGAPGEDSTGNEASGSLYVFLIGELPQITQHPISRTVPLTEPGSSVSFTASVTGYAPIQFQWRKNGVIIPEASGILESGTTTYTIPETEEADAGIYDVVITNAGGVTTSAPATLTVNALSVFEQIFPNSPPDALGFVFVTLSPPGIGGWRFEGEQNWRASGIPATGLATGDRVVEFRPVPGYLQPPPETVGVISGGAATSLQRIYYETPASGTGGLTVTLKPEDITLGSIPVAERAQWKLLGEEDSQWRDSETNLSGLIPGNYLIEFKPVTGRTTPSPGTVFISDGETANPVITYFIEDALTGTPPDLIPFETVTTDQTRPYAFVGQIRSDVGASSGFVIMPRVVATAAHVTFDDGTLSAVTGLQWLFQRHNGTNEPKPQIPRGFYIFEGYAAQREADGTPGSSTPESQNLDAAAIYFSEDAGRGGSGGFLASDSSENEFLLSPAAKTLVGYPVDGISPVNQGRMHATPPANISFTPAFGKTYTTHDIRSNGGASGGPICVQFEGGSYYPAAIYLGGTGQTVVRAIDSDVIDLFSRAQVSANGGDNNTGGGISHTSVAGNLNITQAGSLKVIIEPSDAVAMGAAWQLKPETLIRQSGTQKSGLTPGTYNLQFKDVSGFQSPTLQAVSVTGGPLTTITFTYQEEVVASPLETWRQTNFQTTENTGDAADDADPDKDGRTNIEEYTAGTDPNAPNDFIKILEPTISGSTFTAMIAGKTGRTYKLQRNPTLAGDWITVATQATLSSDQTVTLTDTSAPLDQAYYRIEVSVGE
ncbi:MAG: immunoglobulin domain-containing protein [Luteolibacter sp.]